MKVKFSMGKVENNHIIYWIKCKIVNEQKITTYWSLTIHLILLYIIHCQLVPTVRCHDDV